MTGDQTRASEDAVHGESEQPMRSAATSDSGFDGALDETLSASGDTASGAPRKVPLPSLVDASLPASSVGTPTSPPRASSATRGVTRNSLGPGVEGLVLYDLTNAKGDKKEFSPHCVKTILDLKLLDVGYDRQRLTFVQVRNDLAARVGDNAAMVPTLELSDGTHLSDSWMIAIYLASHHSRGSALFPFPSSRPFAASLNVWGKTGLAPHLVPLTRPAISACLDGESHEYFENVKVGKAKMDKFRALAYNERQHLVQACVNALEPIQAALAAVLEAQNSSTSLMAAIAHASSPLWLEGSQEPTHADFCVFGWYVHTRSAGQAVTREIWHTHPLVSQWVNNMNNWAGPEITADFP